MKILITGAEGQLGYDLIKEFGIRDIEIIPTDISDMDITDKEAVDSFIFDKRPDAIIHAAAWTAVDAAESDPDECKRINIDGTRNVAEVAAKIGARIMYISTDYVFDGTGIMPWKPDSQITAPLNVYGLTKYQGELAIQSFCKDYIIVRISWVFGKNGKNFIKTMLDLGLKRNDISVVDDQIGSPTYTKDLSRLLADMIISKETGIFHATNEGFCSWYELASEVFSEVKNLGHTEYDLVSVHPVSSSDYPVKANRPLNSRMDNSKLILCGFKPLPSWQDAVKRFIKELGY